ncbi:MAG: hypothetical protein K9G01_02090 [Candidatus Planktophila sp.]|nr:hypothetical protein [Candidatus Planktophila sp.]
MFRKIASVSVALVVAGGVMVAIPAEAAAKISNGVACTKSGSTTKTSLGTYKCAKNPLVSSTKLTWLSIDCINSANSAVKAQKDAVVTAAKFAAQLPIIELGITTEIANRAEIQAKLDAANVRLVAAQGKLTAAKTEADKKVLTTAVSSWTSATRAYASKIRSIDLTIKKLEAAKLVAINKPAELASNVAGTRESAKLICTKGL